ncbi:MAG: chemotaxis protein CheB [Nitriliruptoraceae bacterium]
MTTHEVSATALTPARPDDHRAHPALVVGIGASAGGLDALQRVVAGLEPGLGIAYVIVQHLSPDHPSLMVEILERHTALPVARIEDQTPLKPDTVHVLPPRSEVRCAGGLLLLEDRSGIVSTPIDRFLTSLADDQGPRAVAVVLSGTGSDGSRGARSVADAGGLVLAQDPETAAFDGMPRAAITTGAVDLILPPEEMATAIRDHADHPQVLSPTDAPVLPGEELGSLLSLVKQHTGTDFSLYKRATVTRRIERRMNAVGVDSIGAYLAHARDDGPELARLRKELLIGVTRFLRDEEAFTALADDHLEDLLRHGSTDEPLRVWVAGCSTGEEAYTLAILLDEARTRIGSRRQIRVFATDIDREAVEVASRGSYPIDAVTALGEERIERYFVDHGEFVTVTPQLRQMVVFAAHDVTHDPPFPRLGLVSCRNLLIYLEPALQQRVLGLLHFSLEPGGLLLLGPSETLGELASSFETLERRWKLFRRTSSRQPGLPAELRPPRIGGLEPVQGIASLSQPVVPDDRTIDACYRELVDTHVPPCLLVNEELQLVHVFGDAHRYLRVPRGAATLDLQRMLPGTTATLLRAAVHRALRTGDETRYAGVLDASPEGPADVRVRPFRPTGEAARYALVFIEPPQRPRSEEVPLTDAGTLDEDVRERIEELEHALQDARETLQATVEELETSNEELQATNEELLASNEELQATNEELHSVNEELHSVNAEYQDKIDELVAVNSDLDHLFASTHVGVVFVDEHLKVRKFTAGLAGLVNLIERDLDRPLADITHQLDIEDLPGLLAEVAGHGQEVERLTHARDGRDILLRAEPFRDGDGEPSGAVLSLTDVSPLQHAQRTLQARIDALPEHLCVLDPSGRIVAVNQAWERFARDNGGTADDHLGIGADYLGVLAEASRDDPDLRQVVEELQGVLAGSSEGFAYAYPCDTADGEERSFVMHVRPVPADAAQPPPEAADGWPYAPGAGPHGRSGAVVSHVDITRAEQYSRAAEERR